MPELASEQSGLLVAISGLDGSGKTTLATRLLDRVVDEGLSGEIANTPMSRAWQNLRLLRRVSRPLVRSVSPALMGVAIDLERLAFLQDIVVPSMRLHDVVLLQRYTLDWAAISIALKGSSAELEILAAMEELLGLPTCRIFLRIDPEVAAERLRQRGRSLDPRESTRMLERTAVAYDELCAEDPSVSVLDAEAPPDILAAEAFGIVESHRRKQPQPR